MTDFTTELTHRKRVTLQIYPAILRELIVEYAAEQTGMPIDDVVEYEVWLTGHTPDWRGSHVTITQDLTKYGAADD